MKALYLRVWLTVVAVLALFALGTGWLAQRHVEQERARLGEERQRMALQAGDRVRALGELIGQALPDADRPVSEQAQVLLQWAERLRMPAALDDAQGRRIAASPAFERRMAERPGQMPLALQLEDGRTLWLMRGGQRSAMPPHARRGEGDGWTPGAEPAARGGVVQGGPAAPLAPLAGSPLWMLEPWRSGGGLLALLALLFVAVAVGAYPVVRGLTRRLESLQRGVERFGAGALAHRVDEHGRDEVARLAASFNRAADRIEALVQSHSRLVANASHELRSPLARLKVALGLLQDCADDAPTRDRLRAEIARNLRELDELIEEILLSSRLQAQSDGPHPNEALVDLLAVVAEEAARAGVEMVHADPIAPVRGQDRLLRRAVRNLLDNALRYGRGPVEVEVRGLVPPDAAQKTLPTAEGAEVRVLDRGPGVPSELAERIFEPFYRLPGHAEAEGGVGLGLALVRQIAQHHGGRVSVQPRPGGGSCFSLQLPASGPPPAGGGE